MISTAAPNGRSCLFNMHEARSQWPGEEAVLNGGARWPIRRLSWRQLARGWGALSRASCPALPRLANNTGTLPPPAPATNAAAAAAAPAQLSRPRQRQRAPPPALLLLLPAPFPPPPPSLYLSGREGRNNSGVSTFQFFIPSSGCRVWAPVAEPPSAAAPWVLASGLRPPEARCWGSCGRGLGAAGSGGASPGTQRRRWEGSRVLPGPGRTPRGAGSWWPLGAAARANFAAGLGQALCGPAGCTAASALTWPSRERTAVQGGGVGRPPPDRRLPAGHRRLCHR